MYGNNGMTDLNPLWLGLMFIGIVMTLTGWFMMRDERHR
jgi:hypothetical protein